MAGSFGCLDSLDGRTTLTNDIAAQPGDPASSISGCVLLGMVSIHRKFPSSVSGKC